MKLVYATTNPGKLGEVRELLGAHNIVAHSPQEFGVALEVAETGATLEENAILKAETYARKLPADCVVIGDDTGVEIKALGGEPGIRVRRWKGYKMTDAEIITYCLERMKSVPKDKRQAQFRTVFAVTSNRSTKIFSGTLDGEIVENPTPQLHPGFPFETLFYVPKWKIVIGEVYKLKPKDRELLQTHRHQAILSALPYLKNLLISDSH